MARGKTTQRLRPQNQSNSKKHCGLAEKTSYANHLLQFPALQAFPSFTPNEAR